ncbi:MAG: hypothetical protein RRX95_03750 [Oscillospiraceae bacterium]
MLGLILSIVIVVSLPLIIGMLYYYVKTKILMEDDFGGELNVPSTYSGFDKAEDFVSQRNERIPSLEERSALNSSQNSSYSRNFVAPVIPRRENSSAGLQGYGNSSSYSHEKHSESDDYSNHKHYADKEGAFVNRQSDEEKYATGYKQKHSLSSYYPPFKKSQIKQYSHTFNGSEPWDKSIPKEKDPWDKNFRA